MNVKAKYVKEYLLFPDIIVTGIVFIACLIWTVPHLNTFQTWIALALGMAGYAASEYMIHRFLFHMKPPKNAFLLKMIKRLHYDHHVTPNELNLLFLPVWYSLPLIAVSGGIAYGMTRSLTLTIAFVCGVIGYLLIYEWVHFVAHRPIQPRTPWGRWMKKLHLWHHYKNEHYWYGVTNPVLDVLMGTFEHEKNVERSTTARNLEQEQVSKTE